jgi:hypothetical protein
MHRLEVKRNSKATEKAPKQVLTPKPAPPFRRKIGVAVQDQDKPHLGIRLTFISYTCHEINVALN